MALPPNAPGRSPRPAATRRRACRPIRCERDWYLVERCGASTDHTRYPLPLEKLRSFFFSDRPRPCCGAHAGTHGRPCWRRSRQTRCPAPRPKWCRAPARPASPPQARPGSTTNPQRQQQRAHHGDAHAPCVGPRWRRGSLEKSLVSGMDGFILSDWRVHSTTVSLATLSASHLVPWRGKLTCARASSPVPSMASTLPSPNLA